MSDKREQGIEVLKKMLPELADAVSVPRQDGQLPFGADLMELGLENLFGSLWTRPGLDWRSRSLVTLGILMALRANDQLVEHFKVGLRNGLTPAELEEVVYHASGYLGFPAAGNALGVAARVVNAQMNE